MVTAGKHSDVLLGLEEAHAREALAVEAEDVALDGHSTIRTMAAGVVDGSFGNRILDEAEAAEHDVVEHIGGGEEVAADGDVNTCRGRKQVEAEEAPQQGDVLGESADPMKAEGDYSMVVEGHVHRDAEQHYDVLQVQEVHNGLAEAHDGHVHTEDILMMAEVEVGIDDRTLQDESLQGMSS